MRNMEDMEEPIAERHARYQALVNRNPPIAPDKLRSLNLGYKTNIDWGEAAAVVQQRSGQHFELFNEVHSLVEFQSRVFLDEKGVQPRVRWEEIVAEEFTTTLREWTGFLPLMVFLRREADVKDVGVCAWRDEWDWRPVPVERGAFFPSPYAKVDVDTWDICGIADSYDPYTLLGFANDPEAATAEGWNVEQVRRLLVDVFVGSMSQETERGLDTGHVSVSRWEQLQTMIRNNEPSCMSRMFEPIKVRHILVREPKSGRISHLIFSTAVCGEADDFLCQRLDRYERMSQAVFILPANYGNGYVRGVRGLLADVEGHCALSNRYMCDIVDAGRLSGTLMLKNMAGISDPRRLQLVRAGSVTLLPPGVEALQASSFAPPLSTMVMVRDLSSSIMRNNTGVFRQMPETWVENQPPKTARQVAEEVSKEARLEKANVAFDYAHLQLLYREMYRRMINPVLLGDATLPGAMEAQAFVRRCLQRGVPEELLTPDALRLMVVQAIGAGSWGVRLDVTSQLVSMRALFDEAGRRNAVRDRLAALVGQRNVDRYLAPTTRDDIPSNETSIAVLENTDMKQGAAAVVGQDQNHVIHVLAHLEPLQELLQVLAEKGLEAVDPQGALQVLSAFVPHIAEHLGILGEDPSRADFIRQVEEVLKAALVMRKQLEQEVERLMAEQQAQQEEQARMLAEAQGIVQNQEVELERQKAAGLLQIKADMNRSLMAMREQRQAHGSAIAATKVNADIALKSQKQAADIQLEQQLAAAKIQIEQLKAEANRLRKGSASA